MARRVHPSPKHYAGQESDVVAENRERVKPVSHGASNCDEGCFDPDQNELIAPRRKVRQSLAGGTFIAKTDEASILKGLHYYLSLRQTGRLRWEDDTSIHEMDETLALRKAIKEKEIHPSSGWRSVSLL